MCRLLYIRSEIPFDPIPHLQAFSEIAKSSQWYQGHGWGCTYLKNGKWEHYKNISPIWEDDFSFIEKTCLLISHVRSAYLDEGIIVENNMPFHDDKFIFIFNGELNGVKIKSEGRIGAEKIFNYINRFANNISPMEALEKSVKIINKRTDYVKGMNIIMANKINAFVSSTYTEDPEYYTMHYSDNTQLKVVCSKSYDLIRSWNRLENNSFLTI